MRKKTKKKALQARGGYYLSFATVEHANALAPLVCEHERSELWHLARRTPYEELHAAVARGVEAPGALYALHGPEGIIGMGGVKSFDLLGTFGVPWFLGVDMAPHKRFIVRYSRDIIREVLQRFPVLCNVVGAWNTQSISWLRYVGFTIEDETILLGPDSMPFHKFWIVRGS